MSQFAIDPSLLSVPQRAPEDQFTNEAAQLSEEELKRLEERDRELADLLATLDPTKQGNNAPILPPALLNHYLEKSGFSSPSPEVTALLGLATQKFISDVAADAFTYARTRATTGGTVGRPSNAANRMKERTILTMPDLANALAEYGIPAGRAPYYL